jgi:hypothetical protein
MEVNQFADMAIEEFKLKVIVKNLEILKKLNYLKLKTLCLRRLKFSLKSNTMNLKFSLLLIMAFSETAIFVSAVALAKKKLFMIYINNNSWIDLIQKDINLQDAAMDFQNWISTILILKYFA